MSMDVSAKTHKIPSRTLQVASLLVVSLFVSPAFCGQSLPLAATDRDSSSQIGPGAVVQEVRQGGEGEKAGLQEGDVILEWGCLDHRGKIESSFDLTAVELEEGQRGAVTLDGLRGSEKETWVVAPGRWSVGSRPNFGTRLAARYRRLQDLVRAGKDAEATHVRNELAAELGQTTSWWPAVWLRLERAKELGSSRMGP
jgi:hypothetical protein